ncbi:MAG: energy transducer TonB [Ignavibacteriaceae bacterium]
MNRRQLLFLLVSFLFSTLLFSQEDPYKPVADEMPQPIDGYEGLYKKVVYPDLARKNNIEGKVYVLAYINEKGGVDDVKVVKGIGVGCDEAAADVVKKAKFTQGKLSGQPVKVKLTIPFIFKIR